MFFTGVGAAVIEPEPTAFQMTDRAGYFIHVGNASLLINSHGFVWVSKPIMRTSDPTVMLRVSVPHSCHFLISVFYVFSSSMYCFMLSQSLPVPLCPS